MNEFALLFLALTGYTLVIIGEIKTSKKKIIEEIKKCTEGK